MEWQAHVKQNAQMGLKPVVKLLGVKPSQSHPGLLQLVAKEWALCEELLKSYHHPIHQDIVLGPSHLLMRGR